MTGAPLTVWNGPGNQMKCSSATNFRVARPRSQQFLAIQRSRLEIEVLPKIPIHVDRKTFPFSR
jgi:hypothetical protein